MLAIGLAIGPAAFHWCAKPASSAGRHVLTSRTWGFQADKECLR